MKRKNIIFLFCCELISFSSLKFTIFHILVTPMTRDAYEPSDDLAHIFLNFVSSLKIHNLFFIQLAIILLLLL